MTNSDSHFRPLYHFTPPANWMNDPNGLVFYQGEYHLFYQYHPNSSVWGPMHWGHAISRDLVQWNHLPVALFPDELGLIYSGSAVIDWENTAGFGREAMVAVFTHHNFDHSEKQSLAYSLDSGRSWTKYAGNPVLNAPEGMRDFRDPKVFWYGSRRDGHWVMVLAAQDVVRIYISPDLIHWTAGGIFGAAYGAHSGVWETPDLFELSVDGGAEKRWVMTVGIGDGGPGGRSGMQYFVGSFDGREFSCDDPGATVLWADFGADYYAAVSWNDEPNHRRLMIGWQSNWQYANLTPTTTWRSACSLVREVSLRRTAQGVRLFQHPAPENQRLRGQPLLYHNLELNPCQNPLEGVSGDSFELLAEFQPGPGVSSFGLRVRVGSHEQTTIGYLCAERQVFVDRSHSGQVAFEPGFARRHTAFLEPVNGLVRLHIFLDRICLDIFANDGAVTFGELIFPSQRSQGLEIFSEGAPTVLRKLAVYPLQAAEFSTQTNPLAGNK